MLVFKCIKYKLVIKRGNIWLSNLYISIVTVHNMALKMAKNDSF